MYRLQRFQYYVQIHFVFGITALTFMYYSVHDTRVNNS
jgi:hypothetical protein